MEFFIFLFVIIFFLYFLAILFFNTDIAVDVKRLKLLFDDNYSKKIQIIEKEIDVSFSVFNKIKFLKFKVGSEKSKILNVKFEFDFFENLKRKDESKVAFILELIKRVDPQLDNINLKVEIGTENMFLTIGAVPFLTSMVAAGINKIKSNDISNNFKFIIFPNYLNSNNFRIDLNTQIRVKFLTLMIYVLSRKKQLKYYIEK